MTNRAIVIETIRFIEDNLQEELPVSELSRRAGYSLYHFIRLFQGITGYAPKEYILRRKLTEASKAIRGTGRRIADVAFDFHFKDHETFSRAFKRTFGVSPAEWRQKEAPDNGLLFEGTDLVMQDETANVLQRKPELVEKEAFMLVGISSPMTSGRMVTALWERFLRETNDIVHRVEPERFYQLAFWSERQEREDIFVMPAVEVESLQTIPSAMVGKTIPKGAYLRFVHRGLSRRVGVTYAYIYGTYLPQSEYKPTLPYNFEYCGPDFRGPNDPDSETVIYIPVQL